LIDKKTLNRALKLQASTKKRFGEILTEMGSVDENVITACLAEQYDFPIADLETLQPSTDALALVDQQFATTNQVLPISIENGKLFCVIADPLDIATTDVLAIKTKLQVVVHLAPRSHLLRHINAAYGSPILELVHGAMAEEDPVKKTSKPKKRQNKHDSQKDRQALLESLSDVTPPVTQRGAWRKWLG